MKLNDLLHHVNWNTFHFCGMDVVEPYNCYLTHKKSQEERE
jgi:putative NADPH-quinone reductase